MAKQKAVKNVNADYIKKVILTALNSDPEIKMTFKPGDLGFKAGAGAFVVVMVDGEQYRMNITITQSEITPQAG